MPHKFDSPLKLDKAKGVVYARGDKDDDETWEALTAKVKQPPEVPAGQARALGHEKAGPGLQQARTRWAMELEQAGNQDLEFGPAIATGTAHATEDGSHVVYTWSHAVTLANEVEEKDPF